MRMADEPSTAIGRLALAINSPALAMAASGACASFDGGFTAAASSRAGASATSSGRSRCTGPRGSLIAMRMASFTVSAILPFSSRNDALVIGANSAWWSIHIWMRRPS